MDTMRYHPQHPDLGKLPLVQHLYKDQMYCPCYHLRSHDIQTTAASGGLLQQVDRARCWRAMRDQLHPILVIVRFLDRIAEVLKYMWCRTPSAGHLVQTFPQLVDLHAQPVQVPAHCHSNNNVNLIMLRSVA